MDELEKMMQETIESCAKRHSDEVADGVEAIGENLAKGMLLKDALGVGDKNAEMLYGEAYQLYNIGKYDDAKKLFASLHMLDPLDGRYSFGLAACCHMLKEYDMATDWYMKCSLMESDNPIPHFHASDCYIKMNDVISAYSCLLLAIKYAEGKPQYAMITDRAKMTLKTLKKIKAGENIPDALGLGKKGGDPELQKEEKNE